MSILQPLPFARCFVLPRGLTQAAKGAGVALVLFLVAQASFAAPSNCPASYADGLRPDVLNPALDQHAMELCSSSYAVYYSGVARAPIWSAELLTPGRIAAAKRVPRTDQFLEDTRLPNDWRATLADFRGSGYDRGHMAPAGDMPTPAADAESFLLSNVVAQDPNQNRNQWAAIEKAVRALARHKPVYIITGAVWKGQSIVWLDKRVMVPTHMYKVVYSPDSAAAAAYLIENAANKRHTPVSIAELSAFAGIDFFPGKSLKRLKLPRPRY